MNNSMLPNATEYNGVIVCGPPASPASDCSYHSTITVCGQPASPNPEDSDNGRSVTPSPDMKNYQTVTGYGSPKSVCSEVTYERSRITQYFPISPEESDTDSESSSESSDATFSELRTTPVKESASMEPEVLTPTTSNKRIRRRRLNFHNPILMYDLEDISEDESGEPLAQKAMTDDDAMDNESISLAWINAIANIYKSRNE